MIIKRIHTIVAIIGLDHKFSFDHTKYKLDYHPEVNMFKIDNVLIPVSNIREVLVEDEGRVQVSSPDAVSLSAPDDSRPVETVTKSKTKVKK